MPKRARPRASVKRTKTYTGCWTCRARGVKCDAIRPACNRCQKSKKVCEGYGVRLLWDRQDVSTANQVKGRLAFLESDMLHPTFSEEEIDSGIGRLDSGEVDYAGSQAGPFFVFRLPAVADHSEDEESYVDESVTSQEVISPATYNVIDQVH